MLGDGTTLKTEPCRSRERVGHDAKTGVGSEPSRQTFYLHAIREFEKSIAGVYMELVHKVPCYGEMLQYV